MLSSDTIIDGTYRIQREIGRGSGGIVYLAEHLRLQKYVVLKQSRLQMSDISFLRNEVDLLKELHHNALPQVYDFLQLDGEIYTVIDYIDGQNFDQVVQAGRRFSEDLLVRYMLELADVLCYLHSQQPPVYHNDIKPGNIMLRRDGSLALIDFNISLCGNGGNSLYGFSNYYAAPEQQCLAMELYEGRSPTVQIDGRSDIYSLGSSFYYIMTGRRPGELGVIQPLTTLETGVSDDFLKIVERCMEVEPTERFQTAEELVSVLKRHLRRGAEFRRKCLTQVLIICVCGLLLCSGIWSLIFGLQEKRHEAFLAAYQEVRLSAESGENGAVISKGIEILNTYDEQQKKCPGDWYQLICAVGDACRNLSELSASEEFHDRYLAQAVDYYKKAAAFALKTDMEEATACLVEWACLMIQQMGILELDQTAEFYIYMDTEQFQVLQALQLAGNGNLEGAVQLVEELPARADQTELKCGVYEAMAALQKYSGNYEEQVIYLRMAMKLKASDQIARLLASADMDAAQQSSEPDGYYAEAAQIYTKLCDRPSPQFQDRLCCAAALRATGDLDAAKAFIDRLLEEYPNHFDVLAQAALIYSQSGLEDTAASYARRAMSVGADDDWQSVWSVLEQIAG